MLTSMLSMYVVYIFACMFVGGFFSNNHIAMASKDQHKMPFTTYFGMFVYK